MDHNSKERYIIIILAVAILLTVSGIFSISFNNLNTNLTKYESVLKKYQDEDKKKLCKYYDTLVSNYSILEIEHINQVFLDLIKDLSQGYVYFCSKSRPYEAFGNIGYKDFKESIQVCFPDCKLKSEILFYINKNEMVELSEKLFISTSDNRFIYLINEINKADSTRLKELNEELKECVNSIKRSQVRITISQYIITPLSFLIGIIAIWPKLVKLLKKIFKRN
jgi:hypothetical protein